MNTKKMAGRETLTRPNIKSIHGGIIAVPVPRCKFSATAVPQTQGDGEDAKRNTRTN
jgi:hypothetical protein